MSNPLFRFGWIGTGAWLVIAGGYQLWTLHCVNCYLRIASAR